MEKLIFWQISWGWHTLTASCCHANGHSVAIFELVVQRTHISHRAKFQPSITQLGKMVNT